MVRRPSLVALALALPLLVLPGASCSRKPEPISISEGIVTVLNQTDREWRTVVVTVNDHFRGGAARLAPGGRLTAPLSQFQTGHGQRYDLKRQSVFKVEVTATDGRGEPVALQWGHGK
jgi:hypothetical protein